MAYVCLDSSNNVVAIFHGPQQDPAPEGYAEIDDTDPRIAAFSQQQATQSA